MAIRPGRKRPAQRIDELLEEFDRINIKRSLLGLPRVDPFDGLDLSAPALDDLDGASFGSLAPSPPARAQNTFSGVGADTLSLLDSMVFDDDPVDGASFGSLAISRPIRNPRRAPGPIIGSGGASSDRLGLLDGMIFDDDPIGDFSFGFLAFSPPVRNPRRVPGPIIGSGGGNSDALSLLGSMVFDDDPVSVQTSEQGASGVAPGNVRPPQQRLGQPPRPTRRMAPGDATFTNDQLDPKLVFGLQSRAPAASARRSVGTRAGETVIGRILKRAKRRAMRGAASRGELGLSPEAERFFSQIGLIADPRKVERARRRFRRAFDAGGELGLSPETVELFRRAGLFADPKSPVVPPLSIVEPLIRGGAVLGDSAIRGARATAAAGLDDFTPPTEPFLRGGAFAKDILALGIGAAIDGTLGGFNQVLRELGVSKTTADKLERDFRLLALVGGKAASTRPAAVTGAATPARMFGQEIREAERRQRRDVARQVVRDFGLPRIPQTSTVREFAAAIDNVLSTGQSAVGTVFRGDLGAITIDRGKKGKLVRFRRGGKVIRDIKGGFGLRKIRQKRSVIDKQDGVAFVRETLPKVLSEGRLVGFVNPRTRIEGRVIEDPRKRRAIIEDDDNRVILSLFRAGEPDIWLITAFEKK